MIDSAIAGKYSQYEFGPTYSKTLSSSQNWVSAKNAAGNMHIMINGNEMQYIVAYVFHMGYCGCRRPDTGSLVILP